MPKVQRAPVSRDVILAAAVTAYGLLVTFVHIGDGTIYHGPRVPNAILSLLVTSALAWRQTRPLLALMGASGFLLKDEPPERLAAAVRTVAAGDALLAPALLRRLLDEYVSRPEPGRVLPPPELTEREVEVLRLIGRGRSNSEIAAELFLSETTVKTHVTRIFTKLRLRDRAQAVVLAYETGLVAPHR